MPDVQRSAPLPEMERTMANTTSTRTRDLDHDGRSGGPKWPMVVLALLLLLVLLIVVSFALGWVDFDVSGGNLDVEAPDADVDVNAPDVDVDSGELPDVDVESGDLPDVDVEPTG